MKTKSSLVDVLAAAFSAQALATQSESVITSGKDIGVVATESGKVRGYIHESTYTYKGIPYATAERFMHPAAVERWSGYAILGLLRCDLSRKRSYNDHQQREQVTPSPRHRAVGNRSHQEQAVNQMNRTVLCFGLAVLFACQSFAEEKAKIVFLSGAPSHGRMYHEHRAGNMILAEALERSGLPVDPHVVPDYGYPKDEKTLQGASTIVVFCTGHRGHMLRPHLDAFDRLMREGTGVVMIHWATEAEKGKMGRKFLEWMGGFCDLDWSVNPHWKANFDDFPKHPICNGVKPFSVHDEWYYHMRFVEDMKGLTSILSDVPPAETLRRKDGPRSGNPTVRRAVAEGKKQTVAWAYQRPEGGRGFGFTGAHNHISWRDDDFRKIVLNAILWTAHVEVPENGSPSPPIANQQMEENLDPVKAGKVTAKQIIESMDNDDDGKISKDESSDGLKPFFENLDANNDGVIDLQEAQVIADYSNNQ